MISYSSLEGKIINVLISVIVFTITMITLKSFAVFNGNVFSFINLYSKFYFHFSGIPLRSFLKEFGLITVTQLVTLVVGAIVIIVLSIIFDLLSRSMSWYTNSWLLFGIYLCPMCFVLGLGPSLYLLIKQRIENKRFDFNKASVSQRIQMFLHANSLVFIILVFILTALNIASAFLLTASATAFGTSSLINLIFKLNNHGNLKKIA